MARPAKQQTTKQNGPIKRIELADGVVRYRLRYYLGVDPDSGKRQFHNETFDTLTEARDKAAALRGSKAGGAPLKPSKETFSAYLKRWIDDVKSGELRARTLHDYKGYLQRYIYTPPKGVPVIGRIRLNKLTPHHFQGLYGHLRREQELSPRTVRYLHTILRQSLSHAVLVGQLSRNPTDGVKPPRQKTDEGRERKFRAMTEKQALAFQKAAKQDRFYPLWVLLLHTGMRPAEALGLKWEDLDLDERRIRVQRSLTRIGVEGWRLVEPKTSRARRTITLPPFVVDLLRAWGTQQKRERLELGEEYVNHGFVFAGSFGQPLDQPNLYSRNLRSILERAGLGTWETVGEGDEEERLFRPGFDMYSLRHTHATLLLLAGENVKVVSERLGHASVTLTMDVYSHVLPTMQEAAAEKMQAMLGGGK